MKKFGHFLLVILLLGMGVLLATQPLFYTQPFGGDGQLHFQRLAQLERAIRNGILYPRWIPDLGLGFGFPLFNYYAPLSYYLLLPMRWAGLSLSTTLLLGYGAALWALAVSIYLWGRDLFGATAGIAAAFAAIYSPWFLSDIYQRWTLPGLWAAVWLILSLWALRRLAISGGMWPALATALSYAALLLTHNITGLLGTPLLIGYVLLWGFLRGFRPAARSLIFLAIGLGLAAFFWIPAFWEKQYVQIYQLYLPDHFDYRNNFLSVRELLAAPRPVDLAQANFPVPISLGWVSLALAPVAWWPVGALLPREWRAHRWAFSLATVGLALMALSLSRPVWDVFPLLRFVQFPWRFVGLATLSLAMMAGLGVTTLAHRRAFWLPATVTGMMLFALTWLFPPSWPAQPDPTPSDQIRFEVETGRLGATSAGDYLPIWVQKRPSGEILRPLYEAAAPKYIISRLDPDSLPPGAKVLQARYGLTDAELTVDSPQDFRIRFFWYFFPGWYAQLDGVPLPLFPDSPYGLIAADIPAGRHQITVAFGDTPLRRWAWRISGLSLFLLIGASIWMGVMGRKKKPQTEDIRSAKMPWKALMACAGLSVALTIIKVAYLDRYDNPFRRTLFDGQQVYGVDMPLRVNFGERMILIGCDLSTTVIRADQSLEVALYWRVSSPVDTDYSIGLHLVDEKGRLYGQHDNVHPGYYPTSQLRSDQYIRDVHRLTPWEGAPPGRYTLLVLVYDLRTGNRLDLRDDGGTPLGTTVYPLAKVEILRPTRFPAAEKLPLQQRWDANLGNHIRLLGSGTLPEQIEVGESFLVTLYWQATDRPEQDARARFLLLSEEGETAAELLFVPGREDYPTSSWMKGEIVRDVRSLFVPAALSQDPARPVRAGRYRLRLDLLSLTGPVLGGTDLGVLTVTVPERAFVLPEISNLVGARLSTMATLLGYDLDKTALRPGETLNLTLYWRSDNLTDISYTVFVHFVGPDGRIYAQRDSPPGAGRRPTTGWFPGEIVRDEYSLAVPSTAPSGEYHLVVGWYDPATGQRVPILDTRGTPQSDHILLPVSVRLSQ